jgi:hypothetical protein
MIFFLLIPVIVLYDVDKVSENNQRLIKWIIDSSSDACKIIMTCKDEPNLLDSIISRSKIISIDMPNAREVSYLPILFYFFHFHWGLNEYADCRTSM